MTSPLTAEMTTHEGAVARERLAIDWPELVSLVRGTVLRIVGPSADLDDLTQVALEKVVRGLDKFEGRAELTTYVYRIAANVALNHWRSWKRWLRRFDPTQDSYDVPARAADAAADESLSAHERALRVRALLDRLDAQKRIVLVLAEMEELPASRIAEILECPEPTVRSRLRLARAKLAELAAADPYFRDEVDQ
jgi:RNA polymerase sigma-70 factor (ECF subfamily)